MLIWHLKPLWQTVLQYVYRSNSMFEQSTSGSSGRYSVGYYCIFYMVHRQRQRQRQRYQKKKIRTERIKNNEQNFILVTNLQNREPNYKIRNITVKPRRERGLRFLPSTQKIFRPHTYNNIHIKVFIQCHYTIPTHLNFV